MPPAIPPTRTRRHNMRQIKSKNTTPELIIRSGLHQRGLRYRLHRRDLPGCPDLTFPKYSLAIYVNGCFWHGHNCSFFKWPSTNAEFWRQKINKNMYRDQANHQKIKQRGWRVLIVWECGLRATNTHGQSMALDLLKYFIIYQSSSNAEFDQHGLRTEKSLYGYHDHENY